LKEASTGIVVATGTSGPDGKYAFAGVPTTNFSLEIEEPGKVNRTGYINIVDRIQGIQIYQGLTVPADLTVEYPKAPTARYGVEFMPPVAEYKLVAPAPYRGVPPTEAKRIFA
jgi:hypothetical protein